MIKRVFSPDELAHLPQKGVEAQKIRALLLAYGTNYDFCRFYVSEDVILCETDGSFVVCEAGEVGDISELADFFNFNGFSEIFCSEAAGKRFSDCLECGSHVVNQMRFCGTPVECSEVETEPPLDEVFGILKTSFDIDYESWYVDMSHRIRHKVAKVRRLGGSVLTVQHDINGEALLSQIATRPEGRGQGSASRLILAVCAELCDSDVYVICEDSLLAFYQRIGFEKVADKFIITPKSKKL